MNEDPVGLLPELVLLGAAVFGLLTGLFLPRRRQWIVTLVAAVGVGIGIVAAALAWAGEPRVVFDSFAVDTATGAGRVAVLAGTLLTVCLSVAWVRNRPRETEFVVLLLLAALGALVLVGATDLLLVAAGYLLASVPLYALTAFTGDAEGTEGSLKYYLLGALLGVVLLAGVTILLGVGRSTEYAMLADGLVGAPPGVAAVGTLAVLAGLLFKIGGVPAHFWVPDVTQGAPAPVAAFVTTIPKIGGLIAAYRLVVDVVPASVLDVSLLLAILATASMTLGNLAAFFQDNARRLLAYSTISQVGYLLIAIAIGTRSDLAQRGLLFYLAGYAVTNLGAFAVVVALPSGSRLTDFAGLARRQPALGLALLVCLLGLVGTPPTAVFVGKFILFTAAVDGGYAWLAVVAVVNTVASVFYYLRWVVPVFFQAAAGPPISTGAGALGRLPLVGAYTAAVVSVALGIAAGAVLPILDGTLTR